MMQKCAKCRTKRMVLVAVKLYTGKDEDYGHQYHETFWCANCIDKSNKEYNGTTDSN